MRQEFLAMMIVLLVGCDGSPENDPSTGQDLPPGLKEILAWLPPVSKHDEICLTNAATDTSPVNNAVFQPGIRRFANCTALNEYVAARTRTYAYDDAIHPDDLRCSRRSVPQEAATVSDAKNSVPTTNVQEVGIDEADTVRVGEHHLFIVRGATVEVVDRTSLSSLGVISVEREGATLLTHGERLVTMVTTAAGLAIKIYQTAANKVPELVASHVLLGTYRDARLKDGVLYVLSTVVGEHGGQQTGDEAIGGVPCSAIVMPPFDNYDVTLTRMTAVDLAQPAASPHQMGVLGNGTHFYMGSTGLYLATTSGDTMAVLSIALGSAAEPFGPAAVGAVKGRVKDQWAFKEMADSATGAPLLGIATTTGELQGEGDRRADNHLFILERNGDSLIEAAALHGIGRGEDIRAIRYVGALAYVVTFKKTDPLYAIDLKDPRRPKVLGELHVPGFSTYLHPVSESQLVGVGFDADDRGEFAWYQGVQVSLFDVGNPLAPLRTDNRIHGQRGSSSEVTGDHHAFFFDASTKTLALPLVELTGKSVEGGSQTASVVAFTGAVVYRIEGQTLRESARLTHADLMPETCRARRNQAAWWADKTSSLDINRIYSIDGRLVSVSRFGIRAHDSAQPGVVTQTTRLDTSADTNCFGLGRSNTND